MNWFIDLFSRSPDKQIEERKAELQRLDSQLISLTSIVNMAHKLEPILDESSQKLKEINQIISSIGQLEIAFLELHKALESTKHNATENSDLKPRNNQYAELVDKYSEVAAEVDRVEQLLSANVEKLVELEELVSTKKAELHNLELKQEEQDDMLLKLTDKEVQLEEEHEIKLEKLTKDIGNLERINQEVSNKLMQNLRLLEHASSIDVDTLAQSLNKITAASDKVSWVVIEDYLDLLKSMFPGAILIKDSLYTQLPSAPDIVKWWNLLASYQTRPIINPSGTIYDKYEKMYSEMKSSFIAEKNRGMLSMSLFGISCLNQGYFGLSSYKLKILLDGDPFVISDDHFVNSFLGTMTPIMNIYKMLPYTSKVVRIHETGELEEVEELIHSAIEEGVEKVYMHDTSFFNSLTKELEMKKATLPGWLSDLFVWPVLTMKEELDNNLPDLLCWVMVANTLAKYLNTYGRRY